MHGIAALIKRCLLCKRPRAAADTILLGVLRVAPSLATMNHVPKDQLPQLAFLWYTSQEIKISTSSDVVGGSCEATAI